MQCLKFSGNEKLHAFCVPIFRKHCRSTKGKTQHNQEAWMFLLNREGCVVKSIEGWWTAEGIYTTAGIAHATGDSTTVQDTHGLWITDPVPWSFGELRRRNAVLSFHQFENNKGLHTSLLDPMFWPWNRWRRGLLWSNGIAGFSSMEFSWLNLESEVILVYCSLRREDPWCKMYIPSISEKHT
jgi:hypothetical protein